MLKTVHTYPVVFYVVVVFMLGTNRLCVNLKKVPNRHDRLCDTLEIRFELTIFDLKTHSRVNQYSMFDVLVFEVKVFSRKCDLEIVASASVNCTFFWRSLIELKLIYSQTRL